MKLHRNIRLWYAVNLLVNSAFTLPFWVIFNTHVLGLSNTQAFILGVLPYGLSALFEIPTGSWADKYGRARTFQIGTLLFVLSLASYIFLKNFYLLALLQAVGALGISMQSGSLEALVHDSIKGPDKDAVYARVHGRKMALIFISRVVTTLLSGLAYTFNPRLPFVLDSVICLAGLVVSLWFVEVRDETPNALSHTAHVKETMRIIWSKKALLVLIVLSMLYMFCSEALYAIYQPFFADIKVHLGEFGVFYAVISLLSALGALIAPWCMRQLSARWIMTAMMLAVLFTLTLMLMRSPLITYVALVPSSLAFGFVITLMNTSVQKLISSRWQATALSITSLARTLMFGVAVTGLGVMLDVVGVQTALITLCALTAAATLPFLILSAKKHA